MIKVHDDLHMQGSEHTLSGWRHREPQSNTNSMRQSKTNIFSTTMQAQVTHSNGLNAPPQPAGSTVWERGAKNGAEWQNFTNLAFSHDGAAPETDERRDLLSDLEDLKLQIKLDSKGKSTFITFLFESSAAHMSPVCPF